mgnify:CR=1 FL=1
MMFASAQLYNSSLCAHKPSLHSPVHCVNVFSPKNGRGPLYQQKTRRPVERCGIEARRQWQVDHGCYFRGSDFAFTASAAPGPSLRRVLILALRTLTGALARSPGNSSPCTGVATQYAALPVPRCHSQPPAPEPKLCALPAPVSPTEDATKQPSCGADAFGRASEAWIC